MISSIASRAKAYSHGRAKVLADVWNHPLNRGSKWHALRDYVLWNAVRFTMDARHVVRLPEGVDLIVGQKDKLGTSVYVNSLPDFAEMLFLAHLLQPGDLFADVGANVGMYSVWVSRVTGANVIAMEPVPSTYETLHQNIRLNNLEALIEPMRTAAGDTSGEALMSSEMAGSNHILAENVEGAIQTPIARVDDILVGRCPSAMKIDVEGFELQALRGAVSILGDTRLKAIVIELQDATLTHYGTCEQEVRQLLEDHGFRSHSYDPFSRTLSPLATQSSSGLTMTIYFIA
jgi:FkbM family methyltransferase